MSQDPNVGIIIGKADKPTIFSWKFFLVVRMPDDTIVECDVSRRVYYCVENGDNYRVPGHIYRA